MTYSFSLFKYGSEKIRINTPSCSKHLSVTGPDIEVNENHFRDDLNRVTNLINTDNIGIVVSDKTRLCSYDIYLPWLIRFIENKGVDKDNITFYIAYGTHPQQSDEESFKAYGETFGKYRFVQHDCDDSNSMVTPGVTSRGIPATVRKEIFDHDQLILFGAVSHHYFAGYGGGRKLIFPGLGERQAIYSNHKLFIDFAKKRLDPGCQSGRLTGNPVAEDLQEIDKMFPPKVIISGVLNPSGKVSRLIISSSYGEFTEVCRMYDSFYRYKSEERFDLVIASAGGYPKDINFIQTHKSVHNAATFVKNGGTLLLFAECRDGIGNRTFLNIFSGTNSDIIDQLSINYSGNGGTALSMISKTRRINIIMVTNLTEKECLTIGVKKAAPEDIDAIISNFEGSVALIENASVIF
ncbi:MAG: nickel-dependent lactate racemase [Bacteroidales bacterium]|nr:nickel-dependent lactate racemase [Bacteroidales bacterium]